MYPEDRALELEERLHIGEGLVKTIFIHAFMDEHTFEVDRIKKCCTHYALPDGRLMPGCAYNMFYRHKDPRFTGPVGHADDLGQARKLRDAHDGCSPARRALVTGGSRGLGPGDLPRPSPREGARVAFTYTRDEAGAQTRRSSCRGAGRARAFRVSVLDVPGDRGDGRRARAGLGRRSTSSSTTPASRQNLPLALHGRGGLGPRDGRQREGHVPDVARGAARA